MTNGIGNAHQNYDSLIWSDLRSFWCLYTPGITATEKVKIILDTIRRSSRLYNDMLDTTFVV